MYNVLRYWLNKGVDGFRLDTANFYLKDLQFRDNPREITNPGAMMQKHIYDRNMEETLLIHKKMRAICNEYPGDRALIGEIGDENPKFAAFYQGNNDALHLTYNFNFIFANFGAKSFKEAALRHY